MNSKLTSNHRGQGETEKKETDFRLVSDRVKKQGNLYVRLVLGGHKMNRSSHP